MIKFFAGVLTGIYLAQTYPKELPNVQKVVDGFVQDIKKKLQEYQK